MWVAGDDHALVVSCRKSSELDRLSSLNELLLSLSLLTSLIQWHQDLTSHLASSSTESQLKVQVTHSVLRPTEQYTNYQHFRKALVFNGGFLVPQYSR